MKRLTKNKRMMLDNLFANLSEEDYTSLLVYIAERLNEVLKREKISESRVSGRIEGKVRVDKDIKELIGTIPYLFVSKEHFSSNRELADFAKDLGIELPFWEKRSRSEIIGTVIIGLSNMSENRIIKLNQVINRILSDRKAQDKEGFFTQWETAIKELRF